MEEINKEACNITGNQRIRLIVVTKIYQTDASVLLFYQTEIDAIRHK